MFPCRSKFFPCTCWESWTLYLSFFIFVSKLTHLENSRCWTKRKALQEKEINWVQPFSAQKVYHFYFVSYFCLHLLGLWRKRKECKDNLLLSAWPCWSNWKIVSRCRSFLNFPWQVSIAMHCIKHAVSKAIFRFQPRIYNASHKLCNCKLHLTIFCINWFEKFLF